MPVTETKASSAFSISAPVELLNTGLSNVYTHVHPLLVAGLFYFFFESTIADPVSSLSILLPRLCLLQLIYTVLCLPPAVISRTQGQATGTTKAASQQQRKKHASAASSASLSSRIIPAFLSQTLTLFLGTPIITAIILLHGAPLTTNILHTILAGAHISMLATPSLFYAHGVDGGRWRELSGFIAPIDEVNGAAIGALAGAWLGAIPIPLDWDREWQKWPVTIVTGSYVGYAIGKLVGGTILKGTRFSLVDDEEEAEEELRLAIDSE